MDRRVSLKAVAGGLLFGGSLAVTAQNGSSPARDQCASADRISISNPTQKGKFYDSILAKWNFLADALDPQEAAWLGGKESARKWIYEVSEGLIAVASIQSSREGVRIDAFSNGTCGPSGAIGFALIVNSNGALARPDMIVELGHNEAGLPGSSPAGTAVVLIHELIHQRQTGRPIPGFDDFDFFSDPNKSGLEKSRDNNRFVYEEFSKSIKAFESYKEHK